jgi:hypothetical protein
MYLESALDNYCRNQDLYEAAGAADASAWGTKIFRQLTR